MNAIYVDGEWKKAEKMKINSEDKFYTVTTHAKSINYNILSSNVWRYYNDQWEFYADATWKPLNNPNFEVIAYMERINVEAYEGE